MKLVIVKNFPAISKMNRIHSSWERTLCHLGGEQDLDGTTKTLTVKLSKIKGRRLVPPLRLLEG